MYDGSMPVLCCALPLATSRADSHTRCHTKGVFSKAPDRAHLSMFGMLYLEKMIPQPPPESLYINRIGIKWLFSLRKRHGPQQKSFQTGLSKTGFVCILGLRVSARARFFKETNWAQRSTPARARTAPRSLPAGPLLFLALWFGKSRERRTMAE